MTAIVSRGNASVVGRRSEVDACPCSPGDVITLSLFGEIGRDKAISERDIRPALTSLGVATRLHLVIDSEGGETEEADAIYDLFRSLPVPISAEINGKCWSAAVTLLLAADFRWARHRSSILIHRARLVATDLMKSGHITAPDLLRQAKKIFAIDEREVDRLSVRTGGSREWFAREQSTEWLLSDDAALRCGLLHAIEGRDCFTMNNLVLLNHSPAAPPGAHASFLANYRAAERVASMPGAASNV